MPYACVCASVTDEQIIFEINSDKISIEELIISLGVCQNCCCCRLHIENLIAQNS